MKPPDEGYGKKAHGEITGRRDGAVHVDHPEKRVHVQAVAFHPEAIPIVGDWLALEDGEEKKDYPHRRGQGHHSIENPFMDTLHRETE